MVVLQKKRKYINKPGDGVGQLRRYVLNSISKNALKGILTNGLTWIIFENEKFYDPCCASECLNPRDGNRVFEVISGESRHLNCKNLEDLITELKLLSQSKKK